MRVSPVQVRVSPLTRDSHPISENQAPENQGQSPDFRQCPRGLLLADRFCGPTGPTRTEATIQQSLKPLYELIGPQWAPVTRLLPNGLQELEIVATT